MWHHARARVRGVILGGGVIVIASCRVERHQAGPQGSTAEVVASLESYYDAFSDRDWPRFSEHFWPGATLTTVWQPRQEPAPRVVATTVPDFVAQAPAGPGSKPIFEERMTGTPTIRVHRNLAQAWVQYRARFGEPGKLLEWEGIDAFLLLRHEGKWRIVALAYTDL